MLALHYFHLWCTHAIVLKCVHSALACTSRMCRHSIQHATSVSLKSLSNKMASYCHFTVTIAQKCFDMANHSDSIATGSKILLANMTLYFLLRGWMVRVWRIFSPFMVCWLRCDHICWCVKHSGVFEVWIQGSCLRSCPPPPPPPPTLLPFHVQYNIITVDNCMYCYYSFPWEEYAWSNLCTNWPVCHWRHFQYILLWPSFV